MTINGTIDGARSLAGVEPRPAPVTARPGRWASLDRTVPLLATVVATAVVLIVLLLSPLVLEWVTRDADLDFERLSQIGDTYGAAAAVLAALSLAGIALSLLLQAQQAKAAGQQTARMFHFDLVRMKLDEPLFLWAAGWPRPELSPEERTTDRVRQHLYANMWVYYWLMMYELGDLSEANLRALLERELFNGEVGRRYWASSGSTFTVMTRRKQRRFFGIVEDEYRRAIASARPPIPATGPEPERVPVPPPAAAPGGRGTGAAVKLAGAAFLAGVLAGRWGGNPRRPHRDHEASGSVAPRNRGG